MNAQAPKSYAWIAVAIIVAAIIISAAIITSSSFQKTVTNTTTMTRTTTFTTTTALVLTSNRTTTLTATSAYYPDLGPLLQVQVNLNATRIPAGGAVMVGITLFNPLPVNLSAVPHSSTNHTIQTWDDFNFICGVSPLFPAGYALFKGHYTSGNISSGGNPLTLAPPVAIPCVTYPSPGLFLVLPNGSNAVAYYILPTQPPSFVLPTQVQLKMNATTEYCSATPIGSGVCGAGNGLFGYWNTTGLQGTLNFDNATTTSKYFHYFSPGPYTLVVADIWGKVIYSYFQVVSS